MKMNLMIIENYRIHVTHELEIVSIFFKLHKAIHSFKLNDASS